MIVDGKESTENKDVVYWNQPENPARNDFFLISWLNDLLPYGTHSTIENDYTPPRDKWSVMI